MCMYRLVLIVRNWQWRIFFLALPRASPRQDGSSTSACVLFCLRMWTLIFRSPPLCRILPQSSKTQALNHQRFAFTSILMALELIYHCGIILSYCFWPLNNSISVPSALLCIRKDFIVQYFYLEEFLWTSTLLLETLYAVLLKACSKSSF